MRRNRWISQLIQGLRDEDEEVRAEAADRLGEFGPTAGRALLSLAEAVADEDFHVRRSVIRALGRIGMDSYEVVSALEKSREVDCREIHLLASGALLALKVRPQEMVVDVLYELNGYDSDLDILAAEILLELDPENHAGLIEIKYNPDGSDQVALARAMGRVGKGSIVVARILHDYAESWNKLDTDDSYEAILALGDVSAGTGLSIPALVDILTGWALWHRELAGYLLQADEDRALDGFRPTSDTLISLIGALADSWVRGDVQSAAEHVLRRTGSLDEETLIELRDAFWNLGSRDLDLGRFERLSSRSQQLAIPALSELMCRDHCWVASGAARALGKLDPVLAVSHLLAGEYAEDLDRQEAHDIVSEICACSRPEEILAGYRSRQRLQELVQLSGCGGQSFKDAARRTLCEVLGSDLVPTLGQILEGPYDNRLKQVSVEILGDQGRPAAVLIPALIRMLDAETDPGLRSTILEALVRIGQPDDVILPLWVGLDDPDLRVRSSALTA